MCSNGVASTRYSKLYEKLIILLEFHDLLFINFKVERERKRYFDQFVKKRVGAMFICNLRFFLIQLYVFLV